MLLLGVVMGNLSFGFIADTFGRRPTYVTYLLIAALLVWYYGFAREPWVLLVLGPFVADDPSVAEAIVRAALAAAPSSAGLTFNITTTNRPGMGWLEGLGVELEPWDGRMARGAASRRRDEAIYGNALGALG